MTKPKTSASRAIATRLVRALVLAALFGLLLVTTRLVPGIGSRAGTITAVGFLLLTGTLASDLVEDVGLPHLSGYLLAGIVAGPHVLQLIDHRSVEELGNVNVLALSLIAMEGGAELRISALRKGLRSLGWATLFQSALVFVTVGVVFALARPFIPFLRALSPLAVAGVAALWATLSVSRSPSATLGILSQTRANGPLTGHTLAFVMSSDVVVVVLMAVTMMIAEPMIDPAASFSLDQLTDLGRALLGSIALGTTVGLSLAAYVRLVDRQLILVLLALGFGLTEMLGYVRFDALLTFMVAGFVVQNLSKQGEKFIAGIAEAGSVVYVVFFATAGAHLDVPLLRELWPVALLFAGTRAFATWGASRLAARVAGDPPVVRRYAWAGLISQAGLTLGLSAVVERAFPTFGTGFRSLAIATVAINEMVGPVLFKLALDRSGESAGEGVRAHGEAAAEAPTP